MYARPHVSLAGGLHAAAVAHRCRSGRASLKSGDGFRRHACAGQPGGLLAKQHWLARHGVRLPDRGRQVDGCNACRQRSRQRRHCRHSRRAAACRAVRCIQCCRPSRVCDRLDRYRCTWLAGRVLAYRQLVARICDDRRLRRCSWQGCAGSRAGTKPKASAACRT